MVRCLMSQPNIKNKILAPSMVRRSMLFIPPIGSGAIVEAQPNTRNELNMLLPMTLPMAISGFFSSLTQLK